MIITVWPFPSKKRMSVFTVHEPPAPATDRIDRAADVLFLKDSFSWSALIFGPLWLLVNRLWLATLGYVAAAVALYLVLDLLGAAETLYGLFVFAFNIVLGFEAHWLKAARLEADGWSTLGAVSGQGIDDCERRFFEGWLPTQAMPRPGRNAAASPSPLQLSPESVSAPQQEASAKAEAAPAGEEKKRRFSLFSRKRKS